MPRVTAKLAAPLLVASSLLAYMYLFVPGEVKTPKIDAISTAPSIIRTRMSAPPDAVTPDGGRYYGPLVDGKLHGKGVIEWTGGERYEGEFSNGMFDGIGKFTAGDHAYQGSFKNGKYHGLGETKFKDGRKYTGAYVNGLFQGKGRYETADKAVYAGDFDRGALTGEGTHQAGDGSHYSGAFRNWRYDGPGKFTDVKGDIYEGIFANGRLNGKGTRTGKDGSRYQGDFENGQFHGQGVYREADGGEYRGEFKHGYFDGKGAYIYAAPQEDGRTKDAGTWRYGALQDKAAEQLRKTNVETALYNQRALLDKAFAALAPNDPQKIDLYLLAIGGDGSQEVFRREVEFVHKQFDRDFGTQGKSLALFNSRNTVANVPMATVTSIRESLAAIAAKMDRENDILFLYLTSHGSKDHKFSLNQNGMELPDLDAKELGKLLKASGIRHPLEAGRGLGLLFGRLHRSDQGQVHHRDDRGAPRPHLVWLRR